MSDEGPRKDEGGGMEGWRDGEMERWRDASGIWESQLLIDVTQACSLRV
jgi:hypothetical protein